MGDGHHILVVDDELGPREALRMILTDRCILSLTFVHVLSSAHGPKTWPVPNMERRAPKAGAGTQATRMETVRDRSGFGCLSRRGQPVGGRNPGARQ
jgi:hypothetical protein